jgi:DNA replication protein DnaC
MGVPKKFHGLCMKDFYTNDNKSLENIRDFLLEYTSNLDEQFKNCHGIFLYGSNGTGKTFTASMIVKEAYRRRYTAKRTTFVEYIQQYTKMWGAKDPEEKELLELDFYNYYKAVEFLVLEEIGKEVDSKIATPILEDLLRYREDKGYVTIICTNLKPSVIEDKYGASVSSIIKGNMTPIKLEGQDKREEEFKERVEE